MTIDNLKSIFPGAPFINKLEYVYGIHFPPTRIFFWTIKTFFNKYLCPGLCWILSDPQIVEI